jgi:hypothetical protein
MGMSTTHRSPTQLWRTRLGANSKQTQSVAEHTQTNQALPAKGTTTKFRSMKLLIWHKGELHVKF